MYHQQYQQQHSNHQQQFARPNLMGRQNHQPDRSEWRNDDVEAMIPSYEKVHSKPDLSIRKSYMLQQQHGQQQQFSHLKDDENLRNLNNMIQMNDQMLNGGDQYQRSVLQASAQRQSNQFSKPYLPTRPPSGRQRNNSNYIQQNSNYRQQFNPNVVTQNTTNHYSQFETDLSAEQLFSQPMDARANGFDPPRNNSQQPKFGTQKVSGSQHSKPMMRTGSMKRYTPQQANTLKAANSTTNARQPSKPKPKMPQPRRNQPNKRPVQNQSSFQNQNQQTHNNNPADDIIPSAIAGGGSFPVPEYAEPEEHQAPVSLHQCGSCGRKFNEKAYKKHSQICQKVFVQKRKEFNTQAQRIVAPEQSRMLNKQNRQSKIQKSGPKFESGGGSNKWKMQSMQLRMAMQAGKEISQPQQSYQQQSKPFGKQKKGGQGGPSRSKAAQQPQYTPQEMAQYAQMEAQMDTRTQCPHCSRKFNEEAANRHIPHCANKHKQMSMQNRSRRR